MPQFRLVMSSVITRGIIRRKLFQCVRLNSLVLCKFHTAQPALVRGVAGRKYFANVERNGASEKVTGPEDFFGIESDDGVIQVKEKSRSSAEKPSGLSTSSSEKEHIFSTSFGLLRFDTDNQPKVHGQFEENIAECEYSYGSDVVRQKIHDPRIRKGNPTLEKFYMAIAYKKEVSDDVVNRNEDVCEKTAVRGTQSDGTGELNDDLGFIDRTYFYDETNEVRGSSCKEKLYEGSDVLESSPQGSEGKEFTQNSFPDQTKGGSSYIDSVYFEGLYDNDNLPGHLNQVAVKNSKRPVQNPAGVHEDTSSKLKTQGNISEEPNLIDSMYFGNVMGGKSANRVQNFIPQNSGELSKDGDINANSESDSVSASHVENIFTPQDNGDLGVYSFNKASDDGDIYTNSKLENICKDLRADSSKFLKLSQETEENLCLPVHQNQMLTASNNEVGFSLDSLKGEKLIKELEKELHMNKTELGCQTSTNGEDVRTAYKYVLKLRKTEIQPDGESGMKLDSKGFRILKNLVPDLSHLTRSELTALLSERVLFCNDDIVVLNKPYNLVVHESKTTTAPTLSSVLDDLACKLDESAAQPRLYTVHRLDKETTGCLLLARSELAAQKLKALFAQRQIEKKYLVVTTRVPDPCEGVIDIPITEGKIEKRVRMVLQPDVPKELKYKTHVKNGKRAITYYKVVATSENAALLDVRPETGLKHQIRVHLGFGLNCPILGDHKYSHLTKLAPQKLSGDILRKLDIRQSKVRHVPMHIHARAVIIPMYLGDRDLFVSAPLPEHIKDTLKCLKFKEI